MTFGVTWLVKLRVSGRRVSQFAHVVLSEVWLNASRFQQSFNMERRWRRGRGWLVTFDELVCAAEESGDNGLVV